MPIQKISFEWTNGDKRTFESTNGLSEADLKKARNEITDELPKREPAKPAAE